MAQTDRTTGLVGNAAFKVPVKAATTANITLSGEQTIDGVACVDGDRVLVKDQTNAQDNGIYVVDTGAWDRAKDFDGVYDVVKGTLVLVAGGATNINTYWRVTTADPVSIDSDDIDFDQALITDSALLSFLQAGTGAVARSSQSKMREIVSIDDFGADPTGTADSAAAIQQAIDTGKSIFIPPGTYKIAATLNLTTVANHGQHIYGAGPTSQTGTGTSKSIIQPTAAVTVAFLIDGTPSAIYVQHFRFSDFTLDMANMTDDANHLGFQQVRAWGGIYQNVRVINDGTAKRGFRFDAGAYTTDLINCRSNILGYNGISLADACTTIHAITCDFAQAHIRYGTELDFYGPVIQGSLDKFDITNARDICIVGGDIEGTGDFLKIGANVNNVTAIGQGWEGFSGTYMSGSIGGFYNLFDNSGIHRTISQGVTWTPVVTFATPGDLSVAYTFQAGWYTRNGNMVTLNGYVDLSTFTHTTASGNLQITGVPIAAHAGVPNQAFGSLSFQGITKANYTQFTPKISQGGTTIVIDASGSAQANATVTASDTPTGGNLVLKFTITYMLALP